MPDFSIYKKNHKSGFLCVITQFLNVLIFLKHTCGLDATHRSLVHDLQS
jgi:hypothetical protein